MLSPRKLDVPTDAQIERSAYNTAFYELGLRWYWDDATYDRLAAEPNARARVRQYVRSAHPHLLAAYDADFLADAVVATKERCQQAAPHAAARVMLHFNWADPRWGEVGV